MLTILGIFCLLIASLSMLAYTHILSEEAVMEATRDELQDLACVIACQIDGDTFDSIRDGDEETTEFLALRDMLHKIKVVDPAILYLYSMRQGENGVEFVVDQAYGYDDDTARLGDVYPDPPPDLIEGFSRITADHEFNTDRWGTVLSGYAPIINSRGESVGLVGVDMDAGFVREKMAVINWSVYAAGMGAIMIAFVGIIVADRSRTKHEEAIAAANTKINLLNNIIRHDMLNTITGMLGLTEMAIEDEADDNQRKLLTEIEALVHRMHRQVSFTRDYQNLGLKAPHWQNAGEVIRRAISDLDTGGVPVSISCDNLEIYGDPLLERVFYNLVDNAVRYGDTLTEIRFSFTTGPGEAMLVCEDDGVGIPAQEKEGIFHRKYYVHSGLGLFLSREVLSLTQLTIRETGREGEGARFEILLPPGTFRTVFKGE